MNQGISPISAVLDNAVLNAEKSIVLSDDDYIDPADGLLHCGRCREPKQFRLRYPAPPNVVPPPERLVPALCKCQKEADAREAQQQRQKQDLASVQRLRSRSLMDDRFLSQTFDAFRVTQDNEKNLRLCLKYANRFDEMREKNQGLLFYGPPGTGKTFSAACIANALLERRVPVIMTSFVKLMEKAQSFDDEGLAVGFNQAKLLIIDDLGAERGTDFALEKVYHFIDSRYRARLPLLLTTNLDLEEMKKASDIRYARIYDRIFELCFPVRFSGPSFRRAEANRRFKEMRELLENT